MASTGGEILVDTLIEWGVDTLFGSACRATPSTA